MISTIIAAVGVIGMGIASIPILCGFGTAGVVAGSAAAGIQAGMGSVAAGSWFATMTSLAMKGTFVTWLSAGGATTVGGILSIIGLGM
jgi:hypothetical protein